MALLMEITGHTSELDIENAIPFLDMREHAMERRNDAAALLPDQDVGAVLELHDIDSIMVLYSPTFGYAYVNEHSPGVGNSLVIENDGADSAEHAASQWHAASTITLGTRVMLHDENRNGLDVGSAAAYFGAYFNKITLGAEQGEDSKRGAYRWWPLSANGRIVGELRDDANGLTIHVDETEAVATQINTWNREDVYELRDMIRELESLTDDCTAYIDTTSLPSADIPEDVDTAYPIWAIDNAGNMLVGDGADDIMSLADYRANRNLR